jgi:hypothetical protein
LALVGDGLLADAVAAALAELGRVDRVGETEAALGGSHMLRPGVAGCVACTHAAGVRGCARTTTPSGRDTPRRWPRPTRSLLAGVAVVMVPSGSIAGTRWIPIAVAAAGLGVELCWLVVVSRVR